MSQEQPEKEFSAIARAEAQRRKRGLMIAFGALVVAALVVLVGKTFGDQDVEATLDKSEQDVLAKTNDPQCRELIAQVEALSARYREVEPKLTQGLLSPEVPTRLGALDTITSLRDAIKAQETASQAANLRYPQSRQELDEWFKYVDSELGVLVMANQTWQSLNDAVTEEDKAKALAKAPKQSPESLRDGATLALYNAFKSFRVWHSAALHPCGAADPGETPWQPPAKAKEDAPQASPAPRADGKLE